jgi:hypothetical protein
MKIVYIIKVSEPDLYENPFLLPLGQLRPKFEALKRKQQPKGSLYTRPRARPICQSPAVSRATLNSSIRLRACIRIVKDFLELLSAFSFLFNTSF